MTSKNPILIDAALLAGILVLENGGETFRAEETVVNFCRAGGCESASAIVFPTGVFVTVDYGDESENTMQRITRRGIDLAKLNGANSITRKFITGELTLEEAYENLKELSASKGPSKILSLFASALTSSMFALILGGGVFDGAIAFIAGFVVQLLAITFKRTSIYSFSLSFIGGSIIAVIAVISVLMFGMGSIERIIVGATMPLLPGLMLTGAIRDTVMGDLVAGTARLVESLLIAISIASGVGIVLSVYISTGGVL